MHKVAFCDARTLCICFVCTCPQIIQNTARSHQTETEHPPSPSHRGSRTPITSYLVQPMSSCLVKLSKSLSFPWKPYGANATYLRRSWHAFLFSSGVQPPQWTEPPIDCEICLRCCTCLQWFHVFDWRWTEAARCCHISQQALCSALPTPSAQLLWIRQFVEGKWMMSIHDRRRWKEYSFVDA